MGNCNGSNSLLFSRDRHSTEPSERAALGLVELAESWEKITNEWTERDMIHSKNVLRV
jgi:hypothetical protein